MRSLVVDMLLAVGVLLAAPAGVGGVTKVRLCLERSRSSQAKPLRFIFYDWGGRGANGLR